MEKKVVKGRVFIVPNECETLKSFREPERFMEKLRRLCGIYASYDNKTVQVWIHDETCDNWQDGYAGFQNLCGISEEEFDAKVKELPESGRERCMGYFPKYFPVELFERKAEGDVVKLHCPEYDVDIELTCSQLDSRYAKIGRFEEVLKRLVE